MSLVNIKIEGRPYQVEEGLTILEAARQCGYEIPSLCSFNHGECNPGSCRVCLVEATGARGLAASCVYQVAEGMEVLINSPKAVAARRTSVELLLSNHNVNCQQCGKSGQCELQNVARIVGAREGMFKGEKTPTTYDDVSPSIVRDTSKCILCGRCVERCKNAHGNGVLGFQNRGFDAKVGPAMDISFADSARCSPNPRSTRSISPVRRASTWSSRPRPPSAPPSARNSDCPSGRPSPARWLRHCAVWASTASTTSISAPTSPSWRKPTSCSTVLRITACCP